MPKPAPEQIPVLRRGRLTLRPATGDDAPRFLSLLTAPEVAQWWGTYDIARVRDEMDEVKCNCAIEIDESLAGWLQVHEETEPAYRHVAFDLMLGVEFHGQGFGPEALRAAIGYLIDRGHHRFMIDPAVANQRAIRAYEAVGFKPVGVMRKYELPNDGKWHDALLMDLLADELQA